MDILVVFPGWASTKSLYKTLGMSFEKIVYVDTFDLNEIDGRLNCVGYKPGEDRLFVLSWSMGTLQAQKFISKNRVEKLILACPTNEFCLTTNPVLVRKMMKNLIRDKKQCLMDFLALNFYKQDKFKAYIKSYFDEISKLSDEYLMDGLKYLLHEKVEGYSSLNRDLIPFVIIGKQDQVISRENSLIMLESIPVTYILEELDCGHNVFYEAHDEVIRLIRGYLNDN